MSTRLLATVICLLTLFGSSRANEPDAPDTFYDAQGALPLPHDYRAWPNIGTGLNMSYGPLRTEARAAPPFTNVFVSPESYRAFLNNGVWPERTIFILEIRKSVAVNNSKTGNNGYFQGDILAIEAEVKDSERFKSGWAFFDMNLQRKKGQHIAESASCYSCHGRNAAVENTFVQFYPVLRDVAKQRGTLKSVPEAF